MVLRIIFQTELMVEIYSKGLVRAFGLAKTQIKDR